MFLPKFLKQENQKEIFELIQKFPFATLVLNSDDGIEIDHLPLLLEKYDDRLRLVGHLAKVNTICKKEIHGDVKVIFHGPNEYISPNWYPSKKEHGRAVPTWNYLVVHIIGALEFRDDTQWKYELLEKQTAFHEQEFTEKWKLADAPEKYILSMLKGIIGIQIDVKNIVAKWKVSKEKSTQDKQGIRAELSKRHESEIVAMLVAEN